MAHRELCVLLSVLFAFHCDPFHGLLHARAFEGSALRREAEEARTCLAPPFKATPQGFLCGCGRNSQVGLFETPVFTEGLQTADRRVLRSPTPAEWDFEGRLAGASSTTELLAFGYDVDGIRTAKSVNGTVTRFVVDKNRDYAQVLEERSISGSVEVAYIYGDDLVSQERAGGTVSFYHYDGQLSTRQLTDASAQVNDSYTYDAFGVTLASIGSTHNNFLYSGEQHDPNMGFYYLRARYLDKSTGTFLSQDPSPGTAFDPASLHRYAYAHRNPVTNSDPTGAFTLIQMLKAVVILALVFSFVVFLMNRRQATHVVIDFSAFNLSAVKVGAPLAAVSELSVRDKVIARVQAAFSFAKGSISVRAGTRADMGAFGTLVSFLPASTVSGDTVTWGYSSAWNRKYGYVYLGNFSSKDAEAGLGSYTEDDLANAIANLIIHEAGHGLGLADAGATRDGSIMNALYHTGGGKGISEQLLKLRQPGGFDHTDIGQLQTLTGNELK